MAKSVIPVELQNLWSVWNIRGFVILSVFLQVLLASIARLRKKSNNRFIVFAILSAYFMADRATTFTFGQISNARRNDSFNTQEVAPCTYSNLGAINDEEHKQEEFAKMFSDYMNYLLIKKPQMMSAVAGIGHISYRNSCFEITHFCTEFKSGTVNVFCTRLVDELTSSEPAHEYRKKGASILSDACNLAKAVRLKDKKWEIIRGVWVEMLTYAAASRRPEKHARALAEGAEFITIFWLWMAHFGIGPHFPYTEDEYVLFRE